MRFNNVRCLFEQSGTFKNEFRKLGFNAWDYDILNEFNETDFEIDLFQEINCCYDGKSSLFDSFEKDDLLVAFFPCTRFSCNIQLHFRGVAYQQKQYNELKKLFVAKRLHTELSDLYQSLCELCIIAIERDLKLIIENPFTQPHYLSSYFPIKPKIIDNDRRLLGDSFKKPTQYFFINCDPENNEINVILNENKNLKIRNVNNRIQRSMITKEYARNFILKYIK